MKVSKFVKVNKNILLEYLYDNENNISDSYKILVNLKDNLTNYSYMSGGLDLYGVNTKNKQSNQLFKLDAINNIYGLIDTANYSFLQIRDYAEGFPTRHDTLRILFPTNYTFGEYIGFYIRVYTFDFNNSKTYDLSNFFYDSTDATQLSNLELTSPPLYFQETVWGKSITLQFPSTSFLSNQRSGSSARPNTINATLTNGVGLSNTSPIFIDFHFLRSKKNLNGLVTYTLTARTPISLPQAPDFEKVGLKVQHSPNGDFFEIFGTFNGNIGEFNSFILNSVSQGKRYYVEYEITVYEQNIRGKSSKIVITDDFNEKVEYRPIIKFSTTTAIIDVVMNIIDAVDSNTIQRRASYGMLQDEVAKYSVNLTKINLARASKPKIYNIKSPEGAGIFGNLNGSAYSDGRLYNNAGGSLFSSNTSKNIFGLGNRGSSNAPGVGGGGISQISDQSRTQVILQPVPVDRLVLSDRFSILAKSENVRIGNKSFFGVGRLQIVLYTFDNIVQFFLARDVTQVGVSPDTTTAPEYLDLTNVGEVKMVIKNQQQTLDFPLYTESQRVDLSIGQIVFRIPASKMGDVRKIFDSGVNLFYITATNNSLQTVIYSGLYTIYDSASNISTLNQDQLQIQADLGVAGTGESLIINTVEPLNVGTALVTRRIVTAGGGSTTQNTATNNANQNATTNNLVNSSVPQTIREGDWTYEITTNSSIIVDGFEYSNQKLKTAFIGSNSEKVDIIGLSIKSTTNGLTLQSKGNQVLGLMVDIRNKLFASLNASEKTQANQSSETFRLNAKNNANNTQTTTQTATASVIPPPQSQVSNKISFLGATYEIIIGVGNKLTISVKELNASYIIYQEQLQSLYPTITNWTNAEFRNNSQLFANGVFVDNVNNVLARYKAL